MVNMEQVEHFIIGTHHFSKDEYALKYRFLLMSSMLFVSLVTALVAGVVRFFEASYLLSIVDISFSLLLLGLFFHLRQKKSALEWVSTVTLGVIFVFFTVVVILLEEERSKLIWYGLLIVASYLLKGHKTGGKIYVLTLLTLVLLYLLPSVELYLENHDVIMTIAAYSCFALFMTFSELHQARNLKSIQKSTSEIALQQQLLYEQTRKNQLTKLANQIVLKEEIENSEGEISCMVLEIDHFDVFANAFGDTFTDELLIQVSEVLQNLTTHNVSLYHIYSGRFALLIKQPTYNQDVYLATIIKSLFENFQIGSKDRVTIHFLIAIVREKSKTLTHANMTIREIKRSSKSDYKIYHHDEKKEEEQKNNIYWANRLSELMHEDKIIVYYQPIIDNSSGDIVKYECLVRAVDGDKIISPYFFLPAAKSKGILKNITKIVIDKSFQTFEHNNYDFSINITEQDLSENYLVDFLLFKVKQYNIDPKRVFLEVLENINAEDSYDANAQFEKLRALGFGLAIDDFGAEASNLSRLLILKADLIKIDGQFIKNLDSDTDSVKIVETVVSLAKKMHVKTVAEFVHNEEIYNIVKALGVDFSQGYYFSAPLPQVAKQHVHTLSA